MIWRGSLLCLYYHLSSEYGKEKENASIYIILENAHNVLSAV